MASEISEESKASSKTSEAPQKSKVFQTREASEIHKTLETFFPKITVIGLGYVGLPLAVALAKHFPVMGFDINQARIEELQKHYDRTDELSQEQLQNSKLFSSFQVNELSAWQQDVRTEGSDLRKKLNEDLLKKLSDSQQSIIIVTVPTPVTADNMPDLQPLQKATEMLAKVLKKNSIVVYESTVYPGVTEEFCGPLLEKMSGLKAGVDFYLGYSPERINPGDKVHCLENITKVVSGQNDEIAKKLAFVYGKVNRNNIFIAKNIKTAEAAKVIENAQRDINIAFVNEIATIVGKLGLSVYDVLAAAETKWNFLQFKPGLVGGHCIGVDPYYLAECARKLGHEPEIILSGRRTNESMGKHFALAIHEALTRQLRKASSENSGKAGTSGTHGTSRTAETSAASKTPETSDNKTRILLLGLTFKENTSDLRNTKVIDVLQYLRALGHEVDVHDARAHSGEAMQYFGERLLDSLDGLKPYDCVLGAVPHQQYLDMADETLHRLLKPRGLLADLKNMWSNRKLPEGIAYWTL